MAAGDTLISMSVLHHFEATPAERAAYLKMSRAVRGEAEAEENVEDAEDAVPAGELNQERYAAMSAAETPCPSRSRSAAVSSGWAASAARTSSTKPASRRTSSNTSQIFSKP